MQLVIKNGFVFAWHPDGQDILDAYDLEYEIVRWVGSLMVPNILDPFDLITDPRTQNEKDKDALKAYKIKRRREYPSIKDQLDMLHDDTIDGTTEWADSIKLIKEKYPKPK